MLEVHKSKHSLFRLKITVGSPRCCGVCGSDDSERAVSVQGRA